MSVTTTVNQITSQEVTYIPAVIAGVQAAEIAGGTGESKFGAVLDTVIGVSGAVSMIPSNPAVQGVAALVNLTVAIFKALGHFKSSTPAPAAQAAAVATGQGLAGQATLNASAPVAYFTGQNSASLK